MRTCGDEGGTTKAGKPCSKPAGWGTMHVGTGKCKLPGHGGANPYAQLNGVIELARRDGLMPSAVVSPAQAILEAIARTNGEVIYWDRVVQQLEAKEAAGPVITQTRRPQQVGRGEEDPAKMVVETTLGPADIHIAIKARIKAEDRLVHYSEAAIRANISERAIKLAEGAVELIEPVINGSLETILGRELTDADRAQIQSAILERVGRQGRLAASTGEAVRTQGDSQ